MATRKIPAVGANAAKRDVRKPTMVFLETTAPGQMQVSAQFSDNTAEVLFKFDARSREEMWASIKAQADKHAAEAVKRMAINALEDYKNDPWPNW